MLGFFIPLFLLLSFITKSFGMEDNGSNPAVIKIYCGTRLPPYVKDDFLKINQENYDQFISNTLRSKDQISPHTYLIEDNLAIRFLSDVLSQLPEHANHNWTRAKVDALDFSKPPHCLDDSNQIRKELAFALHYLLKADLINQDIKGSACLLIDKISFYLNYPNQDVYDELCYCVSHFLNTVRYKGNSDGSTLLPWQLRYRIFGLLHYHYATSQMPIYMRDNKKSLLTILVAIIFSFTVLYRIIK